MTLWLTRQRNGQYMLTHFRPIITSVEGQRHRDAYIVAGEPIGVRNLCSAICVIANLRDQLRRLESIQIELTGAQVDVITDAR